jgi:hypothetical protein
MENIENDIIEKIHTKDVNKEAFKIGSIKVISFSSVDRSGRRREFCGSSGAGETPQTHGRRGLTFRPAERAQPNSTTMFNRAVKLRME